MSETPKQVEYGRAALIGAAFFAIGAVLGNAQQQRGHNGAAYEQRAANVERPSTVCTVENKSTYYCYDESEEERWKKPWAYGWAAFIAALIYAFVAAKTLKAINQQAISAKDQVDLLRAQTDLSRDQFQATHRPKLHIRHVWVKSPLGRMTKQPGFDFATGDSVSGNLVIVNIGTAAAQIMASEYRIVFVQSEHMPPGCYVDLSQLDKFGGPTKPLIFLEDGKHTLVPGESISVNIDGVVRMGKPEPGVRRLREFSEGGWRIFVVGQITYEDDVGRGRFIGFCRKSDMTGGFLPVDDPDYEYQD